MDYTTYLTNEGIEAFKLREALDSGAAQIVYNEKAGLYLMECAFYFSRHRRVDFAVGRDGALYFHKIGRREKRFVNLLHQNRYIELDVSGRMFPELRQQLW